MRAIFITVIFYTTLLMLPAVHYNNNLYFHLFKFHMRTHIIKIHHRDTGINLPPCGEPPLPSNDMFEALSSTVSILQREVRYLYFYNCYYSCITNRFSNRVNRVIELVQCALLFSGEENRRSSVLKRTGALLFS